MPHFVLSVAQNWKICFFLYTDVANKLVVSLITLLVRLLLFPSSWSDNKLNKLQCIQNHEAWLVLGKCRHANATSLLRTLHWLPVKAKMQYKIAFLCLQCIYQNTVPPYLSNLLNLHPYCPSRMLHSLDMYTSLLIFLASLSEPLGNRSLSVFGPTVWNSLPLSLRKIVSNNF